MYNPEDKTAGISRMLLHYQGVVRENCKRLLRASTAACSQAGAVFRTKATWDMNKDVVAEWASESGEAIPFLLVAGAKSFYKDFQTEMMKPGKSKLFNPQIPEVIHPPPSNRPSSLPIIIPCYIVLSYPHSADLSVFSLFPPPSIPPSLPSPPLPSSPLHSLLIRYLKKPKSWLPIVSVSNRIHGFMDKRNPSLMLTGR